MVLITLLNTQDSIPTLALGYLAAYYSKYGVHKDSVSFRIVECARTHDCEVVESLNSIMSRMGGTDVLAITTLTQDFMVVKEIIAEVKKKFGIPIIIGGYHVSALPHSLPLYVEVGVMGEGEETFKELVDIFVAQGKFSPDNLKNVRGICYYENNELKITPRRPEIQDLDIIPFPARHLFSKDYWKPKKGNYMLDGKIFGDLNTSRGCPYECVFCSSHKHLGPKVRFFSAERVVEEIRELHDVYGCNVIGVNDDLATMNITRLEKIADLLEQTGLINEIQFYSIQARVNIFNQRLCDVLKRLKVKRVAMGIESGTDKTLNYLKGNTVTVQMNKDAINLALKNGFDMVPMLIIGAPHETKEDILKTLEFTTISGVNVYHLCLLTPLPGTAIWAYAKSKGLVSDDMDWGRLSLEVNEKTIHKKVYLCEHVRREEMWELIKEPVARLKQYQLGSIQLNIARYWLQYITKFIKKPYKYFPLAKNILFAKIKQVI